MPKLLDFGIAKILSPEAAGETVALTGEAQRLMTPDYASPEQIRGEPITTATDVYSLGVLLYELLTGVRPFQLGSASVIELERVICNRAPAAPSTAVAFSLPRDLDNVVMMAMRKEPVRRYASGRIYRRISGSSGGLSGAGAESRGGRLGFCRLGLRDWHGVVGKALSAGTRCHQDHEGSERSAGRRGTITGIGEEGL